MTLRPRAVLETALYCDDLEAAEEFYGSVLGLELILREEGRHVFFRCGQGVLLLFDPATTSRETTDVEGQPVPLHGARGPGHTAFSATRRELERWHARLQEAGIEIEAVVDWPSGARSLYFRDPAGNSLEFATPDLWGLDGAGS